MVVPSKTSSKIGLSVPVRRGRGTMKRLLLISCGIVAVVVVFVLLLTKEEGIVQKHFRRRRHRVVLPRLSPWEGLPVVDQTRDGFGSQPLTGTFLFRDTEGCKNTEDCQLFFPATDLGKLVEQEESLLMTLHTVEVIPPPETKVDFPPIKYVTNNNLPSPSSPDTAVLTRTGFKGGRPDEQKNQDRILAMTPYRANNVEYPSVLALFDGHGEGGHVVSHHAALQLPTVLEKKLKTTNNIKDGLVETFREIENTLPQSQRGSGSTGIVMLQTSDNKMYVANTGDSFAFIASHCNGNNSNKGRQTKILYETKAHKPHLPEESKRIHEAGGFVYVPPANHGAESSRVLVEVGGMQLALAMSRSIGDAEATAIGVIADPTVDIIDLNPYKSNNEQLFAIAATDGVWDRIDHNVVAAHLGKALFEAGSLLEACEQVIMASSNLWYKLGIHYRDDISIAVTRL